MKEIILMVGILTGSLISCASDYEKGTEALKQEKYEEAITLFEKISEKDKYYRDAQFNAGLAYYRLGKWEKAVAYLSKGNRDEAKSKLSDSYYQLGKQAYSQKQWSEAISFLSKASALMTEESDYNQDAWFTLGMAYYNVDEPADYYKIIEALEKIKVGNQNYQEAQDKLEELYYKLGLRYLDPRYGNEENWNKAVKLLSKINKSSAFYEKAQPYLEELYYKLGYRYLGYGNEEDWDKAVKLLSKINKSSAFYEKAQPYIVEANRKLRLWGTISSEWRDQIKSLMGIWQRTIPGQLWSKVVIDKDGTWKKFDALPTSDNWGEVDEQGEWKPHTAKYSDTGERYYGIILTKKYEGSELEYYLATKSESGVATSEGIYLKGLGGDMTSDIYDKDDRLPFSK